MISTMFGGVTGNDADADGDAKSAETSRPRVAVWEEIIFFHCAHSAGVLKERRNVGNSHNDVNRLEFLRAANRSRRILCDVE